MITKQEVQAISEADEAHIASLESRIDGVLKCDGTKSFDVRGISAKVRAEIERRYRAGGWTVTYHSDQRDGDFWLFT